MSVISGPWEYGDRSTALAETGFRRLFCGDSGSRLVCQGFLRPHVFSDFRFDIRHLAVARAGQEILFASPPPQGIGRCIFGGRLLRNSKIAQGRLRHPVLSPLENIETGEPLCAPPPGSDV